MFLCFSDLHIGHRRVRAEILYDGLTTEFYPQITDECSGIFFAGDFYDRLINLDADSAYFSSMIIHDLFKLARKHKCFLRVLRGTLSHDKNQLQQFNAISKYYPDVDFRYFDEIGVENIKSKNGDVTALYLPDNLAFKDSQAVVNHVKQILKDNKLTSVDLLIGHGYFDFVVPPAARKDIKIIYDKDMFEDIVDGYVVMGHVHTPSSYKNIAYCGSFDRLNHGEEESKGFLKIERKPDWKCTFIKHKNPVKFITIKIPETDEQIDKIFGWLPKRIEETFKKGGGFLRLVVNNLSVQHAVMNKLITMFPKIEITCMVKDDLIDSPVDYEKTFEVVHSKDIPTVESLPEDICLYLSKYHKDSKLTKDRVKEILEQLSGG